MSLEKMELSKNFKKARSFLKKAGVSCILAFALFFGNLTPATVHADTDIKINPFVWLMTYFGVNIYTDAQQISDDVYSAISLAWSVYQESLQDNGQRVSIEEIIDSIEWTPSQPNTLRLSGWAFNALKSFADYLDSKVTTASEALEIGSFETVEPGSYAIVPSNTYFNFGTFKYSNGNNLFYGVGITNQDVRFVIVHNGDYIECKYVSRNQFSFSSGIYNSLTPDISPSTVVSSYTYQNQVYYLASYSFRPAAFETVDLLYDVKEKYGSLNASQTAIYYTYGDGVTPGDTVLNDVFALPEQAVLDDLIGAADPNQEVEIDLTDSDIAYTQAATMEDLIDMINEYVDARLLDNDWAETVGKVIAQTQSITNEITDVEYPNAITWEVPELINTPQIIPLITPECPDLSACLVSGIQDVGQALGNVIESNANVSNYVSVILFMGIALTILGGI